MDDWGPEDWDEADAAWEAIAEHRRDDGECVECGRALTEEQLESGTDECGRKDCKTQGYPSRHEFGPNAMFANPGGNSALRAATPSNPRNLPCPTCGRPNRLTPADKARGYQCDSCADAVERGF